MEGNIIDSILDIYTRGRNMGTRRNGQGQNLGQRGGRRTASHHRAVGLQRPSRDPLEDRSPFGQIQTAPPRQQAFGEPDAGCRGSELSVRICFVELLQMREAEPDANPRKRAKAAKALWSHALLSQEVDRLMSQNSSDEFRRSQELQVRWRTLYHTQAHKLEKPDRSYVSCGLVQ